MCRTNVCLYSVCSRLELLPRRSRSAHVPHNLTFWNSRFGALLLRNWVKCERWRFSKTSEWKVTRRTPRTTRHSNRQPEGLSPEQQPTPTKDCRRRHRTTSTSIYLVPTPLCLCRSHILRFFPSDFFSDAVPLFIWNELYQSSDEVSSPCPSCLSKYTCIWRERALEV